MSSPPAAEPGPTSSPAEPTVDADADADIDAEMADVQQPPSQTVNGTSSSNMMDTDPVVPETQPTSTSTTNHNRKDATLREFLSKMDDYAPIIPDAVTAHYLTLAGLPPPSPTDPSGATTNTTPLPLARLLALATQKFIAEIAADAYQYSRTRASNTSSGNNPLGTAVPGVGGGPQGTGGVTGGIGGRSGTGAQATQLGVQRSGFGGGGQGGSGQGRTVLTMEDLGMAVQEYGISVKRGEFYR